MPIVTLELPEEVVARWEQLPENERDVFALVDLVEEFAEQPSLTSLSDEDIESIRQGFEDSDAGRVIDGDTLFTELYERVGLKYVG